MTTIELFEFICDAPGCHRVGLYSDHDEAHAAGWRFYFDGWMNEEADYCAKHAEMAARPTEAKS